MKNYIFLLTKTHTSSRLQLLVLETTKLLSSEMIHRGKKTFTTMYHGPVWITLNSFIWNIKTMKHKPSTKRQLHVSHHTALLFKKKKEKSYTEKQCFFSWMVKEIHRTDSESWTWLCHLHAPNPTWQQEEKRGGWERKEKQGKAEEKNGTAIFVWRQLGQPVAVAVAQDLKGSCDWSERIRQSGNAAVPQKDNH